MGAFARGYETHDDWRAARPGNKNDRWISRKHAFFPDLTRKELEETPYKDFTVTWMRWADLTPDLKQGRVQALQVLRRLRSGDDFASALEAVGMIEKDAVLHLSPDYLWFDENRQTVCYAPSDSIEAEMQFYERNVGLVSIVTKNSQDRSDIGRCMASVHLSLESGADTKIAGFTGKMVIDADGVPHYFETNLEKLYEIAAEQEEPEFFEIYSNGD